MPQITESVGRVLGKRYRLLSALGTGASAHVYLAEDVSLQRHVAVKVLQPALAQDASFLKRFGAEARSVASLNHPNVLRVFDWGEDADGPYLVLEYLGGGSLRDILDGGTRLSHAQAARLGAEAARGLAYAHARGLVHRDVKPANLLFDEDGRVRVADFGVARALAEAAWTEPAGAMVGTARYASPEQAEGQQVDGRSDVYSLALVLYESVTGEVPFVADTTFGTLMARVGAPLPRHPALGPLDNVLARAAAPEAAARLDAAGLAARLDALAAAMPAPAPLPIKTPEPEGTAPVAVGFRAPSSDELTQQAPPARRPGAPGPDAVFDLEAVEPDQARTDGAPPITRRRRRWPWIVVAVVVVLAALGGGLYAAAKNKVFTASHPVPTLVGQTLTSARALVAKDHFTLVERPTVYSTTVAAGVVEHQSPDPRTSLKEGSSVAVTASKGLPPVTVPSLTGFDCAGAQKVLALVNLTGQCLSPTYSSTVPTGQVINWSYDNVFNATSAPYHSTVLMAISNGPAPVPIPSVAGQTYLQAQATLNAAGFQSSETQQTSTTVAAGQAIGTNPAAGADALKGTSVTVLISEGPPLVNVPSVVGGTVASAIAALNAEGIQAGGITGLSVPQTQTYLVTSTSPAAGASVPIGSSVTLSFSG